MSATSRMTFMPASTWLPTLPPCALTRGSVILSYCFTAWRICSKSCLTPST